MRAARIRILIAKELSEQARSYRLLVILALFGFFGLGSPLIAKFSPEAVKLATAGAGVVITIPAPTAQDAVAQFIKNLSQIVLLVLVLLASGSVVAEKERGTLPFLLVRPLSRSALLLAKLVGFWIPVILGTLLSAAGCLLYTEVLFGAPSIALFARTALLVLLHLLTFVTTSLFWSSVARSQAAAAVLSFLSWVLPASLGMLGRISDFLPGRLLSLAASPAGALPVWEPIAGSVALMAISVAGAVAALRRWEP